MGLTMLLCLFTGRGRAVSFPVGVNDLGQRGCGVCLAAQLGGGLVVRQRVNSFDWLYNLAGAMLAFTL